MNETRGPSSSERPPGTRVGRFVLVSRLGQGGMGSVYLAYDPELDRRVAIKLLRSGLAASHAEFRQRMLREAQAMAKVAHRNVVTVYDVGTFEGGVFLAMEFVDGRTLGRWVDEEAPDHRTVLRVLTEAGEGLAAAHKAGLIHRDVKLDNVLVARDGRVLVADFGIVRAAQAAPPRETSPTPRVRTPSVDVPTGEDTRVEAPRARVAPAHTPAAATAPVPTPDADATLTATDVPSGLETPLTDVGGVVGTPGYAAPEQISCQPIDARSDQFSFCVTLYRALYRQKPFPSRDFAEYVVALTEPPLPPPKSDVPEWIWQVIARGLAQEPADRFPDMRALLDALARDPAQRRRRWAASASIVALVAIGAIGARHLATRADPRCRGVGEELTGVWDEGVRARVRAAVVAASTEDTFARVARALDAHSRSWVAMRSDVCTAARIRGELPEDVYRLRNDCLDRQRTDLRALTTMLSQPEPGVASHAVDAAYALTPVSWCADVGGLRASVGLPDDPKKRALVVELRADLATAAQLQQGGKLADADGIASAAAERARAAGLLGTEAEALLQLGIARSARADYTSAYPVLASATWIAQRASAPALVARAASETAFVVGTKLQRATEARVWLELAKASLDAAGGEAHDAPLLASREAALLMAAEWRPDLALPIQEHVVRQYERTLATHPRTAGARLNLAVNYSYLGRRDRVEETALGALAMYEELFGKEHHWTGEAVYLVGHERAVLGKLAPAREDLGRALAIFERERSDFNVTMTLQALAMTAWLEGDDAGTLALARRAEGALEKIPSALFLTQTVGVALGDALLANGKAEEARAACDHARSAQQADTKGAPTEKLYGWDALRCRGEALIALGRAADALEPLRASVLLTRRIYPGDLARARFALARAMVLTRGDRAAAVALAKQARDELAALPHPRHRALVASIDRWLDT